MQHRSIAVNHAIQPLLNYVLCRYVALGLRPGKTEAKQRVLIQVILHKSNAVV